MNLLFPLRTVSRLVDAPLRGAGFRLSALQPDPVSLPSVRPVGVLSSVVSLPGDLLAAGLSWLVASVALVQLEASYGGVSAEVFAPVHCDVCRHTRARIGADELLLLLEHDELVCPCGDVQVFVGEAGLAQAVAG